MALESKVTVSKKEFITLDEDLLKFDLETFHDKVSLNYNLLNLYVDRSYASGFENFTPEQQFEPYLNFTRYYSYTFHEFSNLKYSSFFLKSFSGKGMFLNLIRDSLTKGTLRELSNTSLINYPSFKKKAYREASYSLPDGDKDPLKRKDQIKTPFSAFLSEPKIISLSISHASLNFLLSSLKGLPNNLITYYNYSLIIISNSNVNPFNLLLNSFYSTLSEPLFRLGYSSVPKHLNRVNSKISHNPNFFTTNRIPPRYLKPSNILFRGKGGGLALYPNINLPKKSKLNPFTSFLDNYSSYITLRSSISKGTIRKPLYSLFLISSNILKTHSFRLFLTKKTSSLVRYPVQKPEFK
jgi:hypothetical protein